jgi:hypothetical protein
MPIKSLLTARILKSALIASIVFFPTVSLSQDFGGIAGALIQGAISAQRQQQYLNQQRHSQHRSNDNDEVRRSRHRSNDNDEVGSRSDKNKNGDQKQSRPNNSARRF